MKTMTMLRRRSEFFVFLDSVRSVKSEKEEQKEEQQLSPYEEYLQVLLQMKMASAVSEQRSKMALNGVSSTAFFFPFKNTQLVLQVQQRLSISIIHIICSSTAYSHDKKRVSAL